MTGAQTSLERQLNWKKPRRGHRIFWFVARAMLIAVFFLHSFISFSKENGKPAHRDYYGPAIAFGFDIDGVLVPHDGTGETFRVFLLPNSRGLFDYTRAEMPTFIDIPKQDWERGVPSDIPEYHLTPLKHLIGYDINSSRSIQYPGSSHEDRDIVLSNGKRINPRRFRQDPVETYRAFRTDVAAGHFPFVDAVKQMIANNAFGPAFELLQLSTNPNLPFFTKITSFRGNQKIDFNRGIETLIAHRKLPQGAVIEDITMLSNPALNLNDQTSGSRVGRFDDSLVRRKILDIEAYIDTIQRRLDKENEGDPRPNVFIYAEDDLAIAEQVSALFRRKVLQVRDRNIHNERAEPPLILILWNLAPPWQYAQIPALLTRNPRALATTPVDLATVMIFDSNARYMPGGEIVERLSPKDPAATIVARVFGLTAKAAREVLNGTRDCNALVESMASHQKKDTSRDKG